MPPSAYWTILACTLLLLSSAWAVDVRGTIAPSSILPLSPDSSVVLDQGIAGSAFIRKDGSFLIRNVPAGSYVLSVRDRDYGFPAVTVTVSAAGEDSASSQPVQVRSFKFGHVSASPETVPTMPYPIVLQTTGQLQYYDVPQAFSLMSLIQQNKMILFMVVGVGFAVGMPKLLAMIDPDVLKEVQQSQAEMHRNLGMAQNMDVSGSLSKMLAGTGQSSAVDAGPSPQQRKPGQQKRGR